MEAFLDLKQHKRCSLPNASSSIPTKHSSSLLQRTTPQKSRWQCCKDSIQFTQITSPLNATVIEHKHLTEYKKFTGKKPECPSFIIVSPYPFLNFIAVPPMSKFFCIICLFNSTAICARFLKKQNKTLLNKALFSTLAQLQFLT